MIPLRSTPWEELPELLVPALGETATLVGIVVAVAMLLGTPLAFCLHNLSPRGLFPHPRVHAVLDLVVNVTRSLPFLVLMAAIIPLTRFVMGTSLGVAGAVLPLSVGAIPLYARLVESTLRAIPPELVDVASVFGASRWQTMLGVQWRESVPGIISNLTIAIVAIVEYTTVAGAIGAGGIGFLALSYGYDRFDTNVMIATVAILVLFTQLLQRLGDRLSRAAIR